MWIIFAVLISTIIVLTALYIIKLIMIEKAGHTQEEDFLEAEAAEEAEEEALEEAGEAPEDYLSDKSAKILPCAEEHKFIAVDKLTNLKVGSCFFREAQQILYDARDNKKVYAVCYMDIDRFRFINSIKGYSLGDYVLTQLGQAFEDIFPEGAIATRASADHLVVLFPYNGDITFEEYNEQLKSVTQKIKSDIGMKGSIRICAGISLTDIKNNGTGYDLKVLMVKANIARHCLKIAKSETFVFYDPSMVTSFLYGESSYGDYKENQYDDEFVIYYQPIARIKDTKIQGAQALVRWSYDDENTFTPVTPDSSKIPTNNAKVLYNVCHTMSKWRKLGKEVLPVYISLNETEFFKKGIDSLINKCIDEFLIETDLINIVVDESVIRTDTITSGQQIKKLRDIGVKVGVEGINISNTNIEYLAGLNISFIKADRSFTDAALRRDTEAEAKIAAIVNNARALNLTIVFEGIDSPELFEILEKLGVKYVQGKYSGNPEKADDFVSALPEYIAKLKNGETTVILDEIDFNRGHVRVY